MIFDGVRILFLISTPFAVISLFIVGYFCFVYSRTWRGNLEMESIPNTKENNGLLLFALFSLATFLVVGGVMGCMKYGINGESMIVIGFGLMLVPLSIFFMGQRIKDLRLPKNLRQPYRPSYGTPRNAGGRRERLLLLIGVSSLVLLWVLLKSL
jgi:hypothetical protein